MKALQIPPRAVLLFISGLLLLALTACDSNKKESPQIQPTQPANREVSGEVFIVLKNRETLIFSLVDVALIEDSVAARQFNSLLAQPDSALAHYTNQSPGDSWVSALRHVSSELSETRMTHAAAKVGAESNYRKWEQSVADKKALKEAFVANRPRSMSPLTALDKADSDPEVRAARQAILEAKAAAEDDMRLQAKTEAQIKVLKPIQESLQSIIRIAEVSKVTTGSDGKFQITVPAEGTFWLWATAAREIGDSREEFVWLIPLTSEKSQKIMLSNNNCEK